MADMNIVERIEEDFLSSPVSGVCCITIDDWKILKPALELCEDMLYAHAGGEFERRLESVVAQIQAKLKR